MEEYKKVDTREYVTEGLTVGRLVPIQAEKFARIIARQGTEGEEVISWSADQDGRAIQEKVDKVGVDQETGELGWVVTKADENGQPIIDANGHANEWIIADSTFKKKYEADEATPGLYKPTGGVQTFVRIPENLTLFQWGSDMNIAAGGYINITNEDDMYGISARDFEDTYKQVEEKTDSKQSTL